jgi:hypothetical protein
MNRAAMHLIVIEADPASLALAAATLVAHGKAAAVYAVTSAPFGGINVEVAFRDDAGGEAVAFYNRAAAVYESVTPMA